MWGIKQNHEFVVQYYVIHIYSEVYTRGLGFSKKLTWEIK